jgi:hypothetical protein
MSQIPQTLRNHPFRWTLAFLVVVPALVFTLWTVIALSYTYSSGDRAGFLQKLSRRGWLCKTWEGELQLSAIPGSMPEKFEFTVRSDSVAALVNKYSGERVVLFYEQHKGVPGSCFGDTEYFVTEVRPVGK